MNPLSVVDVGCSGGIASMWRQYQDLKMLGIDPVVDECLRLGSIEDRSDILYRDAFIGLSDDHWFKKKKADVGKTQYWSGNPWDRLSSAAAQNILDRINSESLENLSEFNNWSKKRLTENFFTLDEVCKNNNFNSVDFIKIDVDGPDLEVLYSGEGIIKNSPVLGVAIEVNYYGSDSELDNSFHNTDRIMRGLGFDLFDLTLRRYSSSALPLQFAIHCTAQTLKGRPYQGDALYLRDPCAHQANNNAPKCPDLSLLSQFKLASMYELFGIPDHAVELICQMNIDSDTKKYLCDAFAKHYTNYENYIDLMSNFNKDPRRFYPKQ